MNNMLLKEKGNVKVVLRNYKLPYQIECSKCGKLMTYDINRHVFVHNSLDACHRFVEPADYLRARLEND